jgi:hypothetical protein
LPGEIDVDAARAARDEADAALRATPDDDERAEALRIAELRLEVATGTVGARGTGPAAAAH